MRGKNGDRYIWGLQRAALEMPTSCHRKSYHGIHSESSRRPVSTLLVEFWRKGRGRDQDGFAGQGTESTEVIRDVEARGCVYELSQPALPHLGIIMRAF